MGRASATGPVVLVGLRLLRLGEFGFIESDVEPASDVWSTSSSSVRFCGECARRYARRLSSSASPMCRPWPRKQPSPGMRMGGGCIGMSAKD
jgi:hypothetical protein